MKLADQRGDDMAVFRVVVVAGAVKVGWHYGEEFGAVLPVVAPAHFDAGDLGQGIRAVGRFERAGEEVFFLHRLRCILGVDAAGAEEHQAPYLVLVGGVDDVALDGEVVADELSGVFVVGVNAADLGGGQEDVVGLLCVEEGVGGGLVGEVKFGVGARQELGEALCPEVAHDG